MDAKDALILGQQKIIESLQKDLANTVTELFNLVDACNIINSTLELSKLLKVIMELAERVCNAEASSIFLIDEKSNTLYFTVATGEAGEKVKNIVVPMGQGIAGWVALHGQPLLIPDAQKDRRVYRKVDQESGFVTRSILCVPLRTKEKIIGVVQVLNKKGKQEFNSQDQRLLQAMANQAAVAIETARLYQKSEDDRRRIESIVNSMGDGIIVTDSNYQVELLNNAAREVFQVAAQNGDLKALSHIAQSKMALLLGELRKIERDSTFDIALMKPERLILSNRTTLMRDENNKFTGAILALRNISDMKERERRRLEFLSLVSHKLQEPAVELVELWQAQARGEPLAEDFGDKLDVMRDLITNLVYFSEIEAGPMRITRYEVQLADIVKECVDGHQPTFARKRLEVASEVPADLPVAHVDLERIKVVLNNMFDLICKQAPPGSRISLQGCQDSADEQLLRFTATFESRMKPEKIGQIFDRAYQAENYITLMGEDEVGLGLAFAKHILEAHGGDIWADVLEGDRIQFTATMMK